MAPATEFGIDFAETLRMSIENTSESYVGQALLRADPAEPLRNNGPYHDYKSIRQNFQGIFRFYGDYDKRNREIFTHFPVF